LNGYAALMAQGTTTGFIGPSGQTNVLATDSDAAGVIPEAGTLTSLYVTSDSFDSTGDGSATATVFVDDTATSLTCSLSSGTTGDATCQATGASISVAAGDTVSVEIVNSTGPSTYIRDIRWSSGLSS
jgi:hypothetical protein